MSSSAVPPARPLGRASIAGRAGGGAGVLTRRTPVCSSPQLLLHLLRRGPPSCLCAAPGPRAHALPRAYAYTSSSALSAIDRRPHGKRRPLMLLMAAAAVAPGSGDEGGDGGSSSGGSASRAGETRSSGSNNESESSSSEDDEDGTEVVAGLRGILRDSQHHPPPARRSPPVGAAAAAAAGGGAGAELAAAAAAGGGGPARPSSPPPAPCDETVARLKSLASSERRREARARQERGGGGAAANAEEASAAAPAPPRHRTRGSPALLGGYAGRSSAASAAAAPLPPPFPAPTTAAANGNADSNANSANGGGAGGGDFSDANFPRDGDGRTLHLGTRRGEVAPRILSVGSMDRALALAGLLAPPRPGAALFQHLSSRGFLTVTGRYAGRPVSVVTTLMGMPNMDFVARECRAVVDAGRQVAIVRLGTCGGLRPPVRLGDFCVASGGARCLRRNPDAFFSSSSSLSFEEDDEEGGGLEGESGAAPPHYHLSRLVPADPELSALLAQACEERTNGGVGTGAAAAAALLAAPGNGNGNGWSSGGAARGQHSNHHQPRSRHHHHQQHQQQHPSKRGGAGGGDNGDALSAAALAAEDARLPPLPPAAVHRGRNVTADGFYASQGRQGDGTFDDRNHGLVEEVLSRDPLALSMEMETFHLLDLARCSRPMLAAAAAGAGPTAAGAPPRLEARSLRAAAVAITAAERYSNAFIGKRLLRRRELEGGLAALDALVRCELLGDDDGGGGGAFSEGARGAVWSVAP